MTRSRFSTPLRKQHRVFGQIACWRQGRYGKGFVPFYYRGGEPGRSIEKQGLAGIRRLER
jgi:hypothetical protein